MVKYKLALSGLSSVPAVASSSLNSSSSSPEVPVCVRDTPSNLLCSSSSCAKSSSSSCVLSLFFPLLRLDVLENYCCGPVCGTRCLW